MMFTGVMDFNYGYNLGFRILDVVQQSAEPLTVSQICDALQPEIKNEFQRRNLHARVLRRLHLLAGLNKIEIQREKTAIKTEYLLIKPIKNVS